MTDIEMTIKGLERFKSDFKPFCGSSSDWERIDNSIALLKNADLTALDLLATQIAKKANDDGRFFSPYEVGLMLTQHGQHDNRFKWGEVIKYSPSEVEKILKEAKQTDAERGEACGWEPMDPDKLMAWMMLPNAPKPEWISVKDRLPKEKENWITRDWQNVICCCDFGGEPRRIDVRTYGFGNGHFWHGPQIMDGVVTHWMPLPEPPGDDELEEERDVCLQP